MRIGQVPEIAWVVVYIIKAEKDRNRKGKYKCTFLALVNISK